MILYISGRTDIVAFYTPWLLNRFKSGFVDVKNPFYPKKISRIYFKDVDLIVFCTKNPLPIINYLNNIKIPIIFQITLTPYDNDIEPNVIDKNKIIAGIKQISKIIGLDNLFVRYDPILLNDKYTLEYHKKSFLKLCNLLDGYVKHIIISFVDNYKNVQKNMNVLKLKEINDNDIEEIGKSFREIAKEYNITLRTCYEKNNLVNFGFLNEPCVSIEHVYKITGKKYSKWKARDCNCAAMVDIGDYNSCNHLCKYCYANYDEKRVKNNILKHDVNSSILIGNIKEDDEIKVRKH